jgi:hypothetical protein
VTVTVTVMYVVNTNVLNRAPARRIQTATSTCSKPQLHAIWTSPMNGNWGPGPATPMTVEHEFRWQSVVTSSRPDRPDRLSTLLASLSLHAFIYALWTVGSTASVFNLRLPRKVSLYFKLDFPCRNALRYFCSCNHHLELIEHKQFTILLHCITAILAQSPRVASK